MIVAYLRVSTGKQLLENQKRNLRFRPKPKHGHRPMGYRDCKRMQTEKRPQTRNVVASHEKRRFADRYGTVSVESYADRHHDHHGTLLQKGVVLYSTKERYSFDNSLNSSSTLLRFRACCRNRTQFDLHAHPRSACLASGTRCQARTKKAVIPNRKYCWTTGMKLF